MEWIDKLIVHYKRTVKDSIDLNRKTCVVVFLPFSAKMKDEKLQEKCGNTLQSSFVYILWKQRTKTTRKTTNFILPWISACPSFLQWFVTKLYNFYRYQQEKNRNCFKKSQSIKIKAETETVFLHMDTHPHTQTQRYKVQWVSGIGWDRDNWHLQKGWSKFLKKRTNLNISKQLWSFFSYIKVHLDGFSYIIIHRWWLLS